MYVHNYNIIIDIIFNCDLIIYDNVVVVVLFAFNLHHTLSGTSLLTVEINV
jgi:hypothetical protein